MPRDGIDDNKPFIEGKRVKKWLTVCLAEDDTFHIIGSTGTPTWSLILARHLFEQVNGEVQRQAAGVSRLALPGMFSGLPPRTS